MFVESTQVSLNQILTYLWHKRWDNLDIGLTHMQVGAGGVGGSPSFVDGTYLGANQHCYTKLRLRPANPPKLVPIWPSLPLEAMECLGVAGLGMSPMCAPPRQGRPDTGTHGTVGQLPPASCLHRCTSSASHAVMCVRPQMKQSNATIAMPLITTLACVVICDEISVIFTTP